MSDISSGCMTFFLFASTWNIISHILYAANIWFESWKYVGKVPFIWASSSSVAHTQCVRRFRGVFHQVLKQAHGRRFFDFDGVVCRFQIVQKEKDRYAFILFEQSGGRLPTYTLVQFCDFSDIMQLYFWIFFTRKCLFEVRSSVRFHPISLRIFATFGTLLGQL